MTDQSESTRELKTGGDLSDFARLDRLKKGIDQIPIHRIFQSYEHLTKVLLPKVELLRGVQSEDYKLFSELATNLQWALVVANRFEYLEAALQRQKVVNQTLISQLLVSESELKKYTTLEDLALTSSLDSYKAAIVSRLTDNTNFKP